MESLFIINSTGDVFLEKHWRSVISKSICDYFLEKMKTSNVSSSLQYVKVYSKFVFYLL
jgi:AP-3 complex subunit mu